MNIFFRILSVKNHFGCGDHSSAYFLYSPSAMVQVKEATSAASGAPKRHSTNNSATSQDSQHSLLSGVGFVQTQHFAALPAL